MACCPSASTSLRAVRSAWLNILRFPDRSRRIVRRQSKRDQKTTGRTGPHDVLHLLRPHSQVRVQENTTPDQRQQESKPARPSLETVLGRRLYTASLPLFHAPAR